MSHYRLNDVEPSAIVTVNGSEKKIYDNNQIFLNLDDNFEFRFFNPLQEKIGVEIIFNGLKKDNSLLILNPGEDISLDRFMDDKKKMKYSTYFIDGNNEQAVKATEKNGLVEINFYKEQAYTNYNQWASGNFDTTGWSGGTSRSSNGFGGVNMMYSSPGVFTHELDDSVLTTTSNTFYDTTQNTTLTATLDSLNETTIAGNPLGTRSLKSKSFKKETGRVEKGEESDQDFETIDAKFETTAFHTISYEMKPQSTKVLEMNDIKQYCTECGYRIRKKSWKFCPKCGEEL